MCNSSLRVCYLCCVACNVCRLRATLWRLCRYMQFCYLFILCWINYFPAEFLCRLDIRMGCLICKNQCCCRELEVLREGPQQGLKVKGQGQRLEISNPNWSFIVTSKLLMTHTSCLQSLRFWFAITYCRNKFSRFLVHHSSSMRMCLLNVCCVNTAVAGIQ